MKRTLTVDLSEAADHLKTIEPGHIITINQAPGYFRMGADFKAVQIPDKEAARELNANYRMKFLLKFQVDDMQKRREIPWALRFSRMEPR